MNEHQNTEELLREMNEVHRNHATKLNEDSLLMHALACLLYTSPSPRDLSTSRMPSSA